MYAGYPQFQDGIGMMRSFIDEWDENAEHIAQLAKLLDEARPAYIICGTAFARVLQGLIDASPLVGKLEILPVENEFFGGNVDVTCLITGSDLIPALRAAHPEGIVLVAREMFNQDFTLLDDVTLAEVEAASDATVRLCTYTPVDIIDALMR